MDSRTSISASVNVFVYGTLKPNEINHFVCADYVEECHPAIAHGLLYYLPFGYPAMIPTEAGLVQGYVLVFTNPRVLSVLDNFEQHDPEKFRVYAPGQILAANQYQRKLLQTYTPDHEPAWLAWSYVMTAEQIFCLNGIAAPNGCWSSEQYSTR